MSDVALAVIFAIVASLLYALAAFFQQRGAYAQGRDLSLRWGLLARLVRTPVWAIGTAFDLAAYGFEASALWLGSLMVVQPVLITGLLWALPLAAVGHPQRVTRREWTPAILLVVSLAVFVTVGAPSGGHTNATIVGWLIVGLLVVSAVSVAIVSARTASPHRRALLLGFAAGCLYGLTAALTKSTVGLLGHGLGTALMNWQPYALGAVGAIALLVNQSAFHAGHLAASLPTLTVTNPVVSCVIGITLFGEHLQVSGLVPTLGTLVAVAVMVFATVSLAGSPLVTQEDRLVRPVS